MVGIAAKLSNTESIRLFYKESGYFEGARNTSCPSIITSKGCFRWISLLNLSLDYCGDGSWNVTREKDFSEVIYSNSEDHDFVLEATIGEAVLAIASQWKAEQDTAYLKMGEHDYQPQFTPDVIGRCMICGVKKELHPTGRNN